ASLTPRGGPRPPPQNPRASTARWGRILEWASRARDLAAARGRTAVHLDAPDAQGRRRIVQEEVAEHGHRIRGIERLVPVRVEELRVRPVGAAGQIGLALEEVAQEADRIAQGQRAVLVQVAGELEAFGQLVLLSRGAVIDEARPP